MTTKSSFPRDEQLFSWDPENMHNYWAQCQHFDVSPQSVDLLTEGQYYEEQSSSSFIDFAG